MRLFLATCAMALALASTALAQPAPPDQSTAAQAAPTIDLRAPDQQVGPTPEPAPTIDLRAPDQQVGSAPVDQRVVAPASDGGPDAILLVLIGIAAALVLAAAGYLGVRYRHRVALGDDLVVD